MKSLKFAILFSAILGCSTSFAQTAKAQTKTPMPSDAVSGYTYDFNLTSELILSRISKPSAVNQDAQPLLDAPDFPAYKGKVINELFKNSLREWMEKNPALIINTLKHRKDIVTPFN
jgi:hypothetical protein